METKEIVIPDGWEFDKVEGSKIIFKECKKELPSTWGEYDRDSIVSNGYICNLDPMNTYLENSFIALAKLIKLRDCYRQGWAPNWKSSKNFKYIILYYLGRVDTGTTQYQSCVLSFQTKELRDKFLDNFRDLIEEAKDLLYVESLETHIGNWNSYYYWSSTERSGYTTYAWDTTFSNGDTYSNKKTDIDYVRLVRDVK